VAEVVAGDDPLAQHPPVRRWWEAVIMLAATSVFVWLAIGTRSQHLAISMPWMIVLVVGTILPLGIVRDSALAANPLLRAPSLRLFSVARVGCHKIRVPHPSRAFVFAAKAIQGMP
jgi:hypothetical protein